MIETRLDVDGTKLTYIRTEIFKIGGRVHLTQEWARHIYRRPDGRMVFDFEKLRDIQEVRPSIPGWIG